MTDAALPEVPYGSWPSPITAARLMEGAAGVGEIRVDGDSVWWSEQRPGEGGRTQLVRCTSAGTRHDLFAEWDTNAAASAWNARTAVMEYGGGAWGVRNRVVLFVNWADQRLYRVDPGGDPVAVSPDPAAPRGYRWSEPVWLDDDWIVCVREDHSPDVVAEHGEAMNELVALPVDGRAVADPSLVRLLVTGPDFVHSPAVGTRTDGTTRLAWVQWDHPRMPWDGTELVLAELVRDDAGAPASLAEARGVAGGPEESVVQPGFLADGDLVFCTDRTGWWNPWRVAATHLDQAEPGAAAEPVIVDGGIEAEIGGPLWVGGFRWWAELADGRLLAVARADGADGLVVVGPDGRVTPLDSPFSEISQVVAGPGSRASVVAASPVSEGAPYLLTVGADDEPALGLEVLRPHRDIGVDLEWLSKAEHVTFPSAGGRSAHALLYRPCNPTVVAPDDTKPPLVVMLHGGPTSAARHRLALGTQFWTSRGFAVVDVDYGGSTGYGRPFRQLLNGQWGIVDVEDAVAAARFAAQEGHADGDRLAIRGGSAGGFTTLAALCFHDVFAAGASHFGVADLTALATETHKFESRYLDSLVGPWPEARAVYDERSPIHHTDGFSVPLLVLQGDEDEVVPPAQSEMIVDALAAKGVPHAYVLFAGEQHGFRQAANIIRALEAELWFYGRVFGFDPADDIEPVEGAVGLA